MLPILAVLVCAALQILTPLLPQLGVGDSIGSQSDNVETLVTPAGWAFSIWGALYTGSTVFAVYQALPAQRDDALLARIRWPAAGAFLGNALWALYTQIFGLSAVSSAIILFTLTCLLIIYRQFASRAPASASQRWLVYLPLSALAAWLTVATIVNISASLRFHGVEAGSAAPAVAAALVVVGGAIAAAALYAGRGNLPYALVFLWALTAIYLDGGQIEQLVGAAAIAAAVLVIGGAWAGRKAAGSTRAAPVARA